MARNKIPPIEIIGENDGLTKVSEAFVGKVCDPESPEIIYDTFICTFDDGSSEVVVYLSPYAANPTPIEGIDMVNMVSPETKQNEKKVVEAEVKFDIKGDQAGSTIESLIATFPDFVLSDDSTVTATAENVTSWSLYTIPAGASHLSDPADISTATTVEVSNAFVDGKAIRSAEDDPLGGADLGAMVTQDDGTITCACVTFKYEYECDVNGNPIQ